MRSAAIAAWILAATVAHAEGPARYVVVPRSLPLHVAAAADSRVVRVVAKADAGDWLRLRRVGDAADGWIEVATDPSGNDPSHKDESAQAATHCHLSAYDGLALRFFVRAAELATVTSRPVELRFPDGTGAHLPSGVAVGAAAGDGTRAITVDGVSLRAALPADALAADYAGDTELADGRGEIHLSDKTRATLGGAPFTIVERSLPGAGAVDGSQGALVDLAGRCGRYRVRVPAGTRLLNDRQMGILKILTARESGGEVAEGAIAYWRDGAVAGRAGKGVHLAGKSAARAGRSCYQVPPEYSIGESPDAIELCFDPNQVKEVKSIADLLRGGDPGADADKVFATVGGVGIAGLPDARARRRALHIEVSGSDGDYDAATARRRIDARRKRLAACLGGAAREARLTVTVDATGRVGDATPESAGDASSA